MGVRPMIARLLIDIRFRIIVGYSPILLAVIS
jgi:hypothetical protein